MSPNEVKGLQAIAMAAGGSLSINPDTGLVEASFLKRLIPLAAGVALASTGIGAPLAAGMVGGFETLRTGDISKGLMAGLGAYGGAGLAGSLGSAGASAAGTTATEATMAANPQLTGGEIAREMGTAGFNAPTLAPSANPATMTMTDKIGAGFNQVTSTPDAAMAFGKQNITNIGAAAAPMIGDAMMPKGPEMGEEEEDPRYRGSPYRYNLSKDFRGATPTPPNPYYRPTGLGYAEGGDVMMAAGGSYDDEPRGDGQGFGYAAGGPMRMGQGIARDTDEDTASLGAYDAAKKRMAKLNKKSNMPKNYESKMPQVRGLGELAMAQGGSIGGYSDGGRMLRGPGDGMSDSIPAVIGKKQPARLADGEFVVPADVVSHIGNGSTDAGAKKLYAMMDKVRKARTGKKSQGKQINPNKFLPV
jgi:hypothetical protein